MNWIFWIITPEVVQDACKFCLDPDHVPRILSHFVIK